MDWLNQEPITNIESFRLSDDKREITRIVSAAGNSWRSTLKVQAPITSSDLSTVFDKAWLMTTESFNYISHGPHINVVDLFAGCGGLSLGIKEATHAIGRAFKSTFASDIDEGALSIYSRNLTPSHVSSKPIEEVFNPDFGCSLNSTEKRIKDSCGDIEFLIGGPPCQGHSDLNNHTRRNDPRNELYGIMARAAKILKPKHIIIENVLGVRHSASKVVQRTVSHLETLGYSTINILLNAADYGVAQNRKRHFTIATIGNSAQIPKSLATLERATRPVTWAIDDIINEADLANEAFRTSANHSEINKNRIEYLFKNNLYELPDTERPDCHRLKPHSYNSVYGRMRPNTQAPTITSGFGSTGQGRFVHPYRQRTITPHEAARIQFFPDAFDFGIVGRREYQKYIGNAVPPKLGYVLALSILNSMPAST
jgi:DNA (cytosine-5)-methyltransferase 1